MYDRISSFKYAIRGLLVFIRSEKNAWIHVLATVFVIVIGLLLNFKLSQWSLIAVAIGLVWISEAFNTAIERLADAVTVEQNPVIRDAKDIAAAAVLIAAISATVIGAIALVQ